MIRTQISLSPEVYKSAKEEAKRQGISLAEFVRRALRKALPVDTEKPWMTYCGSVETGDRQSSQTIDDVVYGQKG